jgi:hypothetical protein
MPRNKLWPTQKEVPQALPSDTSNLPTPSRSELLVNHQAPARQRPLCAKSRPPGWSHRLGLAAALVGLAGALVLSCKSVEEFSTPPGESYCGNIVQGLHVRTGLGPAVRMRMTLDGAALDTAPGTLSSDDGLFENAPMLAIPQFFHDQLATVNFGEGRQRNLIYMVNPSDPKRGATITVVLSLLENGDTEVRLLRQAPVPGEEPPTDLAQVPIFAIFSMKRELGTCGF